MEKNVCSNLMRGFHHVWASSDVGDSAMVKHHIPMYSITDWTRGECCFLSSDIVCDQRFQHQQPTDWCLLFLCFNDHVDVREAHFEPWRAEDINHTRIHFILLLGTYCVLYHSIFITSLIRGDVHSSFFKFCQIFLPKLYFSYQDDDDKFIKATVKIISITVCRF